MDKRRPEKLQFTKGQTERLFMKRVIAAPGLSGGIGLFTKAGLSCFSVREAAFYIFRCILPRRNVFSLGRRLLPQLWECTRKSVENLRAVVSPYTRATRHSQYV